MVVKHHRKIFLCRGNLLYIKTIKGEFTQRCTVLPKALQFLSKSEWLADRMHAAEKMYTNQTRMSAHCCTQNYTSRRYLARAIHFFLIFFSFQKLLLLMKGFKGTQHANNIACNASILRGIFCSIYVVCARNIMQQSIALISAAV